MFCVSSDIPLEDVLDVFCTQVVYLSNFVSSLFTK